MQETGTLFEDDLLLEQDGRASLEISTLPGTLIGGVDEAERSLGIEGMAAQERAVRGFFAVLRSLGNGRKQQKIFHLGQLNEVVSAIESTRTADIYLGNATYASARSRRVTNVRSLQVAWVDVDCYTQGLSPTPELVDRLVERARFAGIPVPTHIICSGRGLYLKWLLDAPVRDSDLRAWELLQAGLSMLYRDVGADFSAIDQARVLRVVGSLNSKVAQNDRRSDPAMVGVVWDSGRRYTFPELCLAVSQLEVDEAPPARPARAKAAHQVGGDPRRDFILPPELRGNLKLLEQYGLVRNPNLDLEMKARAAGRNGMSAVTLSWCRFLDLRDLFLRRAEASGATGIEEGSRDLAMLWMVNFLAHARMVRSSNVFQEVDALLPAFAGVGLEGPRGYESPRTSRELDTLIGKMKASEAGKKVRFAGQLWDPKYTPSNDYLINLFRITSDEMKGLRTIIDSHEKQGRADSKAPGRSERRQVRHAWNQKALQMRAENARAAGAGEPSVPARKLIGHIAQAVGVKPTQLRQFFNTHDDAAELKEKRKRGEIPGRTYRKAPALTEENQRQQTQAKLDARLSEMNAQTADRVARATEAEETAQQKDEDAFKAVMARFARRIAEAPARPPPDAPEALPRSATEEERADKMISESERVANELIRRMTLMRENESSEGTSMPPPLPTAQISSAGIADSAAPRPPKASKRELLNKARMALKKEPLPASANDAVIGSSSASAPGGQSPAGRNVPAPVATNVIPPDMLESWGQSVPEDAEPAGMPDMDDGYLDSFGDILDTQSEPTTVLGQAAPPGYSAPASLEDPPVAKGATVLSFGRPRESKGTAPAPTSSVGFGATTEPSPVEAARPAAAPAAASNRPSFMPPRKAPAVAQAQGAAPLAFKSSGGLSPEQARANGQSLDFAKLFDDPRYDEQGVQVGYPSAAVWPQDDVAAGSNYPGSEWAAARAPDPEHPDGHIVIELQVGNPICSALLKIPRVVPSTNSKPQSPATRIINGKVVKEEPRQGLDDAMADALADTIVVSRKSPVAPELRGAVEGGIEILRGGVSSYFRIIRPRAHYTDPDKLIFINAKLLMQGSLGEKGARAVSPTAASQQDETEAEAVTEGAPRA